MSKTEPAEEPSLSRSNEADVTAPRAVQRPTNTPAGDGAVEAAVKPEFALPHSRRVWVNRSLRMEQVAWVGFDMDYTLAIYKQEEIDKLSVEATVKKLVERGYPPELAELRYVYDFPVRGLLIDKKYGHILKMDRYKYVGRAFHGLTELPREERRALYHSRRVAPAEERYHWIDTLYALPEAALYAGSVDLLDRYGAAVDYRQLFQDIRECIDEAHRDGAIVDVIEQNLSRFVLRDPELATALHKLRSGGKKLFLLTNSRWRYTESMMTYLLGGAMPEYSSWRQYFDAIVCAAGKPAFFTEQRPLLERNGDQTAIASRIERGKLYENGNIRDFERLIRSGGDAILYVGDHIYGDILRSKKDTAWRTAMIVQEMEQESAAFEATRRDADRLDELKYERDRLEDELRVRQSRLRALDRALEKRAPNGDVDDAGEDRDPTLPSGEGDIEAERASEKRAIEGIRAALKRYDEESRSLGRSVDEKFHRYWGSIFKLKAELSIFGSQVEEYACLYTSRVSNFLFYSPQYYFRSARDRMPHEMP